MRSIILMTALLLQTSVSMAEMSYSCTLRSKPDCHAKLEMRENNNSYWDQWGECVGNSSLTLTQMGDPSSYRMDGFSNFPNEKYVLKVPLAIYMFGFVFNQDVEIVYSVEGVIKETEKWICGATIEQE